MAGLPPITQLGGNHRALFDGYWSVLDPQNTGKVDAIQAAAFLKKSQLREPVLHKIWNMSDPSGRGYLDKQGLFMALRLIAVCQAGKELAASNMALSDPPPKLAGVETPPTLMANKWTIDESERAKHDKVFQGLQPLKGLLPGDKAKPFMLSSKLPTDTLGKIWTLSDINKDGNLDLDEFSVAMKLISLAQSGEVLPAVLPASLMPASKSNSTLVPTTAGVGSNIGAISMSSASASLLTPTVASTSLSAVKSDSSSPSQGSPLAARKGSATPVNEGVMGSSVEWVVTPELKTRYDGYFQGIDKDHDGYVSGEEARSLFMASNLQQHVLAHIWNLCDMEKNGKLNAEQFALAMFLIAEKVRKKEVPKQLTAEMIPPSLRGKISVAPPTSEGSSDSTASLTATASGWGQIPFVASSSGATTVSSTTVTAEGAKFSNDFSAIQELDSITNEIQSIKKEKVELAEDIKAKQELIQQKRVELEGFQENMEQASKQREALEREREEARSKLEQLNSEKAKFESDIAEAKQKCEDEKEEIERLKLQLSAQETSNRSMTGELDKLKQQLEQLRKEEQEYKRKVESSKVEMEKLQKANQNLNNDITQVRQRIENLKEEHQSLSTALTLYPPSSSASGNSTSSGVVNINDVGKLSAELHVPHLAEHDAISARATAGSSSPVSSLSGFSTNSHLDEGTEETNIAKEEKTHSDPFGVTKDPFAAFSIPPSEDSFSGRGFSGKPSGLSAFDPFGGSSSDPFKSVSTAAPTTGEELFRSNTDPFSGATSSAHISASSSASSNSASAAVPPTVDPFSGQDPFKADPFASSNKEAPPQPSSLWGGSSPFDVDPFGQPNIQTPTDPFGSGDPFGDDPFGVKAGGSAANPFQVGGAGAGAGFAAAWSQDDKKS